MGESEDDLIFDDLTAETRKGGKGADEEEGGRKGWDPDKEYDGELGYDLVRSLRGKNVGRRFKRTLFKFGLQLFLEGLALFIIACMTDTQFSEIPFFDDVTYGATLQDLAYLVSFPTLFFGFITFKVVQNWASLVTNRELLAALAKLYLLCIFVIFIWTIWLTAVWILTFKDVDFANPDPETDNVSLLNEIGPFYDASLTFLFTLIIGIAYFLVTIQGLVDEVYKEGDITEPDVDPDDVTDLSDVTFGQALVLICAMPCILTIQCMDLCAAMRKAAQSHYRDYFPLPKKTKRRHISVRFISTFLRILRECITGRKNIIIQSEESVEVSQKEGEAELASQHVDREEEERRVQERLDQERMEEDARAEAERIANAEAVALAAAFEVERKRQEDERLKSIYDEEERKRQEELILEQERLQKEVEDREREKDMSKCMTLSIAQFKNLWSELGTSGSFQAKLKVLPQSQLMCNHLKKAGFHIVFVATPTPTDLEIGLCNTRNSGEDKWFMARFLATQNSFSAVMKAEDSSQVTMFVKKFALAKVLKIDSSK